MQSVHPPQPMASSSSLTAPTASSRSVSPLLSFPIQAMEVKPSLSSAKSALTTLLSQKPAGELSENPFTSNYAAVIVRGAGVETLPLKVFFPFSSTPSKALDMKVKKDASVEETIGAALWFYYEEKREPPLLSEAERRDWDGEEWRGRCNPAAWNLRIVEDDVTGEVDEDFPGRLHLTPSLVELTTPDA
jgi:hypothetical protein